jgi:DNA/RNA-binding domain of Phe-tRNA-synthetase-like protein
MEYLARVSKELESEWDPEEFQKRLYALSKEMNIPPKDAFSAIYTVLIGKDHGPKAAWLLLSLDTNFLKERLAVKAGNATEDEKVTPLNRPEIFSIQKKVSEDFPTVSIGIARIDGVEIGEVDENLEQEKKKLFQNLSGLTNEIIGTYPEVLAYRNLYKAMGVDWHSRRPSPEALLRRIALGKELYTINTCVDSYNLVVMKHRVSVGAFDADTIAFPTTLRYPKEGEEILLLGEQEKTTYKEKELSYFDAVGGYNLDFNYRDAQRTAVTTATKNLYINVDGIGTISPQKVEMVLREACENIMKYCGGTLSFFGVVTAENE